MLLCYLSCTSKSLACFLELTWCQLQVAIERSIVIIDQYYKNYIICLLYTSDAADE